MLNITNCFAIPFEEERNDPKVWFLDHIYHEDMYVMFRKVRWPNEFTLICSL